MPANLDTGLTGKLLEYEKCGLAYCNATLLRQQLRLYTDFCFQKAGLTGFRVFMP